ncbi:MAG: DUF1848 domain-containing protein [Lachnospiraceae bacterium]
MEGKAGMIISASMRTDIPACYSEWFYNRLREGYVCVRNPYYPEQIVKYRLHPDVVDSIVFCTKNPAPMLTGLSELKPFHPYFFVTITPYSKEIEPGVPPYREVIQNTLELAETLGKGSVAWRYDPIFLTGDYTVERHLEAFAEMAGLLQGKVDTCIISFLDLYEKTKRNFPEAAEVTVAQQKSLAEGLGQIGKKYGFSMKACAEKTDLTSYGIASEGCFTQRELEQVLGTTIKEKKEKPERPYCRCLPRNDIGVYNTCMNGCLYCYANYDQSIVRENFLRHNPASPLLTGEIRPGEVVKEAKQESYVDGQLRLDF